MAKTDIRLEGDTTLRRTLAQAAKDLADLTDAHADAGAMVAARAKANAPRRSGRLAGSIEATGSRDAALITADAPYAGVIEFGWPAHHITADPYMRPALEEARPAYLPRYVRELDETVGRIRGV